MAIATIKRPSDFAELVRTHQPGVWRYLRFLGAGEAQADERLSQAVCRTVAGGRCGLFADGRPAAIADVAP